MSEADGNSFNCNLHHGLIWRDTEGTYHPIITEEDCEEIEDDRTKQRTNTVYRPSSNLRL